MICSARSNEDFERHLIILCTCINTIIYKWEGVDENCYLEKDFEHAGSGAFEQGSVRAVAKSITESQNF